MHDTDPLRRPLTLTGFAVHHLLGAGATGEVWLAREDRTGDLVALKRLRSAADGAGRERLLREGALLAAFRHEHVVRLRAVEASDDGTPVLVLDHAAGGSLAALLARRGRLDPGEVVTAAAPLAQALAAAHTLGLLHGDVTPGNVLFHDGGRPLLADLGVARLVGEERAEVEGTADYLAPEVAAGGAPTPAGDVHALAAVCHHMLTGAPPYGGDSLADVLRAAAAGQRDPLRALAPLAPPALLDAVEAGLAPDPAARPSAADLAARLLAAAPPQPVRLRVDAPRPPVVSAPAEPPPAGGEPRWWRRRSAGGAATDVTPAGAAPAPVVSVPVPLPGQAVAPPGSVSAGPAPSAGALSSAGAHSSGGLPAAARPTHAVPPRAVRPALPVEEPEDRWAVLRERAAGAMTGRGARTALVTVVLAAAVLAVGLLGTGGGNPDPVPLAAPAAVPGSAPRQEQVGAGATGPAADPQPSADAGPGASPDAGTEAASASVPRTGSPPESEPVGDQPPESAPGTGAGAGDWRAVVESLDAARAEALVLADTAPLDEVYAPGSEALAADRAVVQQLAAAGVTIRGARHEVRDVTLLEQAPGRARLLVVDVLPAHEVLAADGTPVEHRPPRAPAAVELELVEDAGKWLIASLIRP